MRRDSAILAFAPAFLLMELVPIVESARVTRDVSSSARHDADSGSRISPLRIRIARPSRTPRQTRPSCPIPPPCSSCFPPFRTSRRVPARFADSPARVARRRRVTAVGRRDQDRAVARVRATGGRQRRAGRDRQLPGDGRNGKRRRARRRGARVRRRPRRVADDEGRAAHRVHAGLHQADGRAARAGGEPDHVGDRQEPRRFAEGVRPHRHVHDADDRRAEGSTTRIRAS